jgi:regulator of sigma E protease
VIMNVIFAFIFATVAYKIGVPYEPASVSRTSPGSPAWREAVLPGDEIVKIDDIEKPSFEELMGSVTLGDLEHGVPFVLVRDGKDVPLTLVPEQGEKLARVGIVNGRSLRLTKVSEFDDFSAASKASPPLQEDDEILAVNGQPVSDYAELDAILLQNADQPVTLTLLRGAKRPAGQPEAQPTGGERIDSVIPPQKELTLGLVMEMSKVVAVQKGSPAAKAGLKPGDFIEQIVPVNAEEGATSLTSNPMALPEALRKLGEEGKEIKLTVRRADGATDGKLVTEDLIIPLRSVDWIEEPIASNDPLSAPALGIAYRTLTVVRDVEPNSPAAKAGLQKNDILQSVEFVLPEKSADLLSQTEFEFSQDEKKEGVSLPWVLSSIQQLPRELQLKLKFKRGNEEFEETLTPADSADAYVAERGFPVSRKERIRVVESWGEAASRGYTETGRSLTMVYRFLSKLGSGQVPLTMLGGPLTIAQAAGHSAFQGWGKLLVFLTMLSANLAVINFLPIPMLDGGHMVFLAWEGIRGRPASERVVMTMQTVGMVFLISLMLFVFTLDIHRMLPA